MSYRGQSSNDRGYMPSQPGDVGQQNYPQGYGQGGFVRGRSSNQPVAPGAYLGSQRYGPPPTYSGGSNSQGFPPQNTGGSQYGAPLPQGASWQPNRGLQSQYYQRQQPTVPQGVSQFSNPSGYGGFQGGYSGQPGLQPQRQQQPQQQQFLPQGAAFPTSTNRFASALMRVVSGRRNQPVSARNPHGMDDQ